MTRSKVLLITGPGGSGKTTLARQLGAQDGYRRWSSWTTREPRPGELDRLDYVFVDRRRFELALLEGAILEHVVGPGGELYGLPVIPDDLGEDCLVAVVSLGACGPIAAMLAPTEVEVRVLDCPDAVLLERMSRRGDCDADIEARRACFDAERACEHDGDNRGGT